jgi:hypothetical protein
MKPQSKDAALLNTGTAPKIGNLESPSLVAHIHLPCKTQLNAEAEKLAPLVGHLFDFTDTLIHFTHWSLWGNHSSFCSGRFVGVVGYVSVFTRHHWFSIVAELPPELPHRETDALRYAARVSLEDALEALKRSLAVSWEGLRLHRHAPPPPAVLSVAVPVRLVFADDDSAAVNGAGTTSITPPPSPLPPAKADHATTNTDGKRRHTLKKPKKAHKRKQRQ